MNFGRQFHQDHAKILGGLFDAVVGGLRELPTVKPAKLPRMADFAAFAEAVGRALGWGEGTVLADYNANRQDATATQIEESALATAMLETAPARGAVLNWIGTATDLLATLSERVGKKVASSAGWPKSPGWLTNELRRIAPQLRINGLYVTFERTGGKRLINVRNETWREKYRPT